MTKTIFSLSRERPLSLSQMEFGVSQHISTYSFNIQFHGRQQQTRRVLDTMLLNVKLEVFAQCVESTGQTKVEAQSLLQQIQTKRFIFLHLVTFGKLNDFDTQGLQSPTYSVSKCIDLMTKREPCSV